MPPSVASDAPPISIRWVGPQSVTSWPNSRCHMSSSGKPMSANAPQAAIIRPADRRPPVAAEVDRGLRRALGAGQRDRHDTRHEHAVEADQDQVVSGVRERPGVTAVVDVQGDVPVHAEHGGEERDSEQHRGHRRPRRQARVPLRPARNTSQDLQPSAAMTRDQVGHERRCDERAGRGPDGLADRRLRPPAPCRWTARSAGAACVSTTLKTLPRQSRRGACA